MPRGHKRETKAETVSDSPQGPVTLIQTTYGELSPGTRYSLVTDDDPIALRSRKGRSTKDVDHASMIPVLVADAWVSPKYDDVTLEELITAVETVHGSGPVAYRYDSSTNQIIVGSPKPSSLASYSPPTTKKTGASLDIVATKADVDDESKVTIAEPLESEPEEEAAPVAKPVRTRIRWDEALTKRLCKEIKKKTPLEEIAEIISELACKEVSVAAIKTQAYSNDLGEYLPKKRKVVN